MKLSLFGAFLIALMASGLVLVGSIHAVVAQASTPVNGILNVDITWTKASSPYTLTGNVHVDEGVTLTLEPGVTVSFNSYFMNVSGTLHARGSQTEKIIMTGSGISYLGEWMGRIFFYSSSTNSIIEYAGITSSPNAIIGIYSSATTTISSSTIGGLLTTLST